LTRRGPVFTGQPHTIVYEPATGESRVLGGVGE
jgi:hypothetical protein